eukprot:scaffold8190_cov296-Pinguiococcus_pyrenoidosus.AAC.1
MAASPALGKTDSILEDASLRDPSYSAFLSFTCRRRSFSARSSYTSCGSDSLKLDFSTRRAFGGGDATWMFSPSPHLDG